MPQCRQSYLQTSSDVVVTTKNSCTEQGIHFFENRVEAPDPVADEHLSCLGEIETLIGPFVYFTFL